MSKKDSYGNPYSGLRSQVSPFYRMYFGKKYAGGFFAEAFAPITTTVINANQYTNSGIYEIFTDKKTTVGFGVGFGGKCITKRNIIFEASVGVGQKIRRSAHRKKQSKRSCYR